MLTKKLTFLTARYTIMCTCRLQPTRNDCDVRVHFFSGVVIHVLTYTLLASLYSIINNFAFIKLLAIFSRDQSNELSKKYF